MLYRSTLTISVLLLSILVVETKAQTNEGARVAIVVHGGAGTISRENMSAEREQEYRAMLTEALQAGHEILVNGGSSIDAVTQAVKTLEDSPLFNAGIGAVLTDIGTVEHDASIMNGETLQAGASAATRHVKNPILLARLIMDASPHVMMVGEGAEEFGRTHGLEMVENSYFITDRRKQQLLRQQKVETEEKNKGGNEDSNTFGTVGAVALDARGNLAAATSTGGKSNKHWGRVGDSPIIGAGTFADNRSCAVSSTGDGEYFMRGVIAHEICAMMRLTSISLDEAANAVIHGMLTKMGGGGGVIALDRDGNISTPFNTSGMYRGFIGTDGNLTVEIYRD